MRIRQPKNRITQMHNGDGVLTDKYDEVKAIIVEYYKEFFAAKEEQCLRGKPQAKAPGPDGFSFEFYSDTWLVIKMSVVEAVQTFFATSKMPKYVNSTAISLIPKVQNPQYVKDFRHIACCNVLYKCIFTIIARRLKEVLHDMVGIQQTAYVPDAGIDYSSELLKSKINNENFDYHPGGMEIEVANINFADDLFILCGATGRSMKLIKEVLEEFESCFGLKPNLTKSSYFFTNIPKRDEAKLSSLLGVLVVALLVKYLGIPLTTKRMSNHDCRILVERIRQKTDGWGARI
ncbi:hypothetical protein LIER_21237 [Lithospermum erythrorhizon]|uniref:Reverse transcriptase domain-containing protein n=1 Tax=Lithospermum erythrorhizon TaxID=34254 RepID=A0AAV3QVA0_LITER